MNDDIGDDAGERRPIRIVAAAVCKNGKVYQGARHSDIIPRVFAETGERVTQHEQGFVASDGRFVNRWLAGTIAFRAGQTDVHHEHLLSEHVW